MHGDEATLLSILASQPRAHSHSACEPLVHSVPLRAHDSKHSQLASRQNARVVRCQRPGSGKGACTKPGVLWFVTRMSAGVGPELRSQPPVGVTGV